MSVITPDYSITYAGDGSNAKFDYGFPITDQAQLLVTKTSAAGVNTSLVVDIDFTASGVADSTTANWYITYPISGAKLAIGEKLTITPNIVATQETNFDNQGNNYSKATEDALDKLTVGFGELLAIVDRAVKVPIGSSTNPDALLVELAADVATAGASATTATTQAGISTTQAAISTAQAVIATAQAVLAAAAVSSVSLPASPVSGDILYRSGSAWVSLAKGTARQHLRMNNAATAPIWGKAFPDVPVSGDILYFDGTNWVSLPKGTTLQQLRMNAGATIPEWFTASAAVFSASYASGNQTITAGGLLTLVHGLGAKPKVVVLKLKNTTTEANYAVGDEYLIPPSCESSSNNRGISVVPDATNIVVRIGSEATNTFTVLDKTSGSSVAITNTKWAIVVEAYA